MPTSPPSRPSPAARGRARRPTGRRGASLQSTTGAVGAQVTHWREAIRSRPGATHRVGWGLFQDDVRRGRLISLAGLAILAVIAISFATSPDFVVAGVTVEGSTTLPVAEANRLAGVAGLNIFLVDPQAVAARLSQSAYIKQVTVETGLPNQVIVHVQERRPRVVWVLNDSTPYLISEDGILLSRAGQLEGYVVVYDLETDPATFHLGMPLEHDDAVDVAQRLYMQFTAVTGLGIKRLEWANAAGGITVVTETEQRVLIGDGSRLDDKLRVCAALLAQLKATDVGWSQIDVRSVERAAVVK